MPESIAVFRKETADQVYNQTDEFVHLGGNVDHSADLSIEVDRRTTHGAASGSAPLNCCGERSFPCLPGKALS